MSNRYCTLKSQGNQENLLKTAQFKKHHPNQNHHTRLPSLPYFTRTIIPLNIHAISMTDRRKDLTTHAWLYYARRRN